MARTYEARLRDSSLTTPGFIAIRYRRLFWPLAIGSTIGLVRLIALGRLSPGVGVSYAAILVFMPAFWSASAFALNLPAWSLFLEIIANALHGAVLARRSVLFLAGLWLGCAVATITLLALGLAQWGYGIGPILSCLPREMAFYLTGILALRLWGDELFQMRPSPLASGLGALSYPLYATHVPVMLLAGALGIIPVLWPSVAIAVAAPFLWNARVRSFWGGRSPWSRFAERTSGR
jgi:peptidoglycan/LPS O-acetylase OafA/YrhL